MHPAAGIAAHVTRLLVDRTRVLVAIDGPDAAGKTTLADQVAGRLGGDAVRASVDDFHRRAAERAARGALSPDGYYWDTFALDDVHVLLDSFAAGADEVTTRTFDLRADVPSIHRQRVPRRAALLVDGVFLLRPELRAHWDVTVYLHVSEAVTIERALQRDVQLFGDEQTVLTRYRSKYLPGQALYRSIAGPLESADLVIDNTAPNAPVILRDTERVLAERRD